MKNLYKAIIITILSFALSIPMQIIVRASTFKDMGTKSNVTLSKAWTVNFNKYLSADSVNNANVVVIGDNNNYIDINVSLTNSDKSIVVKPVENYESNKNYTLIVTENVKSADGMPLSEEVRMNFSTEKSYKVVLDAGHGGSDTGAIAPSGYYEKKVALAITLKVGAILNKNRVDTVYTRKDDTTVSLQRRCDISNLARPDYFVSIHANSFTKPTAHGIETWYFTGNADGKRLAKAVQDELIKETGRYNRGLKTSSGFVVLKNTDATSVLVETSFLSNPEEEKLLITDAYQNKLAKAIATGILKCLGITSIVY